MPSAMDKKQREARQREITREMGNLAYLIYRQWWRVIKNRQRRQRLQELLSEGRKL